MGKIRKTKAKTNKTADRTTNTAENETDMLRLTKNELRKEMLLKRESLSRNQRLLWDEQILGQILRTTVYQNAAYVLCYVNYKSEVNTTHFIEKALADDKKVFIPKVFGDEMEFYQICSIEDTAKGYKGIPEPVESRVQQAFLFQKVCRRSSRRKTPLLMIIPGVVFDETGNRIGYGKGYYDKYLAKYEELYPIYKMALSYQQQLICKLPAEPCDKRMDCIITQEGRLCRDRTLAAESSCLDTSKQELAKQQSIFQQCTDLVYSREKKKNGFGTLQEKTIHEIVKDFYCQDHSKQEVKVGSYIADIKSDHRIIEIQNGNFNKLRGKLAAFLEKHEVTVVYPIPAVKTVYWLNEETGELSKGHKSPRKGTSFHGFRELYKISQFLNNPNLKIHFMLLDMDEYRLLNGWSHNRKRGSARYDRLPTKLVGITKIECKEDYLQFLPLQLPAEFTSKDLAKEAHVQLKEAQTCLLILKIVDIISETGKIGRYKSYKINMKTHREE